MEDLFFLILQFGKVRAVSSRQCWRWIMQR